MLASEGYRFLSNSMYVVETQRTRGGKDARTGEDTRPYRFGEFDILAVSMEPSTRRWDSFLFTVGKWLLPRPDDHRLILKFQPVPNEPNDYWTSDFEQSVVWFRSGVHNTIGGILDVDKRVGGARRRHGSRDTAE